MMNRKTAGIFSIIMAVQLCLAPGAGVSVHAAELEEGQLFEDSSEGVESFEDDSASDVQSAENPAGNGSAEEFSDDEGFGDGDVETFSAEDTDQSQQNMQELVLNVQDGEDLTVKLNTLLAQARDKATDEKPCKVIVPPGNYTLTGTLHMYSNIYLYAEGATITKTSPRKEILLRLGDSQTSAGGYDGYRNITIEGGTWDANYESVEDKEGLGGFVGFRIGHATNVTVKNVTFLNNLKSHFLELAGVKNAEVTGCTFRGYWKDFEGGGQECIQIDACMPRIFPGYLPYDGSVCENIVIKNNTFEDVFAGIGSHSMMFDRPYKNITICDNQFSNLKKRAVWCLNYQDTVVTGNTMSNVGGGVYVRSVYTRNAHTSNGQEVSPEGNQYSENILIADNQITVLEPTVIDGKQWDGYGIWISGEVSQGSAGETIPSEDDDPENTANPTTNGVPAGRYIVRGVTAKNNTISGNCDGIKISLAEDCVCRGNTIRLSENHTYNNMGISVVKGSNIKMSYNNISGGNGYGIYAAGTEASQKTCLIYGNTVSGFEKDGIFAARLASGSRIERNKVSANAKNGILVKYTGNSIIDGNYIFKNKERGLLLQKCESAGITDNFASANGMNGIEINVKSDNSRVQGNICGSNAKSGLRIANSKQVSVDGNSFRGNKAYAAEFVNSRLCSYKGNSFEGNGHSDRIHTKNSKIPKK